MQRYFIPLMALFLMVACSERVADKKDLAANEKSDVRAMYIEMVNTFALSPDAPKYRRIINIGVDALPELKKITKDQAIDMNYIAYKMIGEIGDESSIPFLMEKLDSKDVWTRFHVVWGLNCLLELGTYNVGDKNEEEVVNKYKEWWKQHKAGQPS